MSLQISAVAQAYLNEQNIEPNIILEIDGFTQIFGAQAVFDLVRIGEFFVGDGTKIGGVTPDENSRDWIMLKGTTNNISQQINIDRAEGSSITSFKIAMIDKSNELTKIFSAGDTVDDILGREAKVYWQPKGTAHPRDSATLFIGIIDRCSLKQGSVVLNIAHPDQLKRQDILSKANCKLAVAVNNSDTLLFADDSSGFLNSQADLLTYVRIDDEIIQYQAIDGSGNFVACTRGMFGTIATAHDLGADIESFYRLQGKPLDIARRILCSNPDLYYFVENVPVERFVQVDASLDIENAIFFNEFNIQEKYGLTIGDTFVTTLPINVSNGVNGTITGFGQSALGSYILVNPSFPLIVELESTAVIKFHSQWNDYNFGCGLKPYQVDLAQFDTLDTLIGNQHPTLDIYIKDTLNAAEFLEKEIYFPSGIYSVPRKGRVSINITVPPIATDETVVLNEENITNAADISIERTINEKFYNAIVYKYEVDSLEDKFLAGRVGQSTSSTNRIKVGNKVLTIESNGLRNNAETNNLIDVQTRRFLDRYQFGAEKLDVKTKFSTGFRIEIGDTVVFDGSGLNVSDSKTGSRDFSPRIMEVTNKQINLKSGEVSLELTDTSYSTAVRYGTFSPSSIVKTGSTTTTIRIDKSYGTTEFQTEIEKWQPYVGQKITVRDETYSSVQTTRITSITPSRIDELVVSPAITIPTEGMIVECPEYDDSSQREMRFWKSLHCFWNKQDAVISGTTTTITVADGSVYFIGTSIRIHTETYSDDFETTVSDIVGNVIYLTDTCTFTPDSTHLVDNIGFSGDNGLYYAWF